MNEYFAGPDRLSTRVEFGDARPPLSIIVTATGSCENCFTLDGTESAVTFSFTEDIKTIAPVAELV